MAGFSDEGDRVPPPRAAAPPTFDDLTFDETLDDLRRIQRYGTAPIALQRLVHVRMLADTAAAHG